MVTLILVSVCIMELLVLVDRIDIGRWYSLGLLNSLLVLDLVNCVIDEIDSFIEFVVKYHKLFYC